MKHVAVLLAFIVVWLSVVPQSAEYCQASINEPVPCCTSSHCQTNPSDKPGSKEAPKKSANDCCPGGVCSPFQVCSTCGFIAEANNCFDFTRPKLLERIYFFSFSSPYLFSYSADFWQPPQIG